MMSEEDTDEIQTFLVYVKDILKAKQNKLTDFLLYIIKSLFYFNYIDSHLRRVTVMSLRFRLDLCKEFEKRAVEHLSSKIYGAL